MQIRDKTAIVTGAGSGIGRELALALGRAGSKVAVTDLHRERAEETVKDLEALGAEASAYQVDHSKLPEVEAFLEKFMADRGHVDIMCCNAGVGVGGRIEEMTIKDWEWLMSINLWGAIYMVQLFVPKMIERGEGGAILITASGLGLCAAPGMAPYSASKFAMVGLAESLRIELSTHDIGVSALCPGIINTNIVRDSTVHLKDSEGENVKSKVREFYANRGTDPAVVARHGLKAIRKDIPVMPTPLHAWPPYLLRRLSPALYQGLVSFVWKKGWLF